MRRVNIIVANPAGNITIFVLDRFDQSQYRSVATSLLAHTELKGEQVGFCVGDNRMDMSGMEFCGNASRAFAMLVAKNRGLSGKQTVSIDVSGCPYPLDVDVDMDANSTKIKMPNPISINTIQSASDLLNGGCLVTFEGIKHVVLTDKEASLENFHHVKDYVYGSDNPPAFGTMFYNSESGKLIPVVYVKGIDSTYFEGSCASGSTAVAAALALKNTDGLLSFMLPQPAGTVTAIVEKSNGEIKNLYIEGPVEFGEAFSVEI